MKKHYLLFLILFLALVLRFWNLTVPDLVTDDALNAFRSLGWYDYLGGGQSTPLDWFETVPWWANLSFHDAPPLVYLIQKTFFVIFGDNTFAARLPSVLAGIGSVFLIYLLGKTLKNEMVGLLAALLLATSSLHIFISHIGYLEAVEIFFIILSCWLFVRHYQTKENKFLYFWAIALGLALMTKYTAIFLLPLFFGYLLFFYRSIFKKKEFWFSAVLCLVLLSPVIFYNYNLYITRGHFDAALSSMIGIEHEDFASVSARTETVGFIKNIPVVFSGIINSFSWPLLIFFVASVVVLLAKTSEKNEAGLKNDLFILLGFVLTLLLLIFGRLSGPHFVAILIPWIVMTIAIGLDRFIGMVNKVELKKIFSGFIIIIIAWELFYGVNSIFLIKPITKSKLFFSRFSPTLSSNLGFNQLEKYLRDEAFPQNLNFQRPRSLKSAREIAKDNALKYKTFYFFDESIHWFAYSWYIQKYLFYYGLPITSLYNTVLAYPDQDPIQNLKSQGIENFYFIYPVDQSVLDPEKASGNYRAMSDEFANVLETRGVLPTEIKNHAGGVAFKVYKFN